MTEYNRNDRGIFKVSEGVARTLIAGWYATEPGCEEAMASTHFPGILGDVFDLDCALLEFKADGWYIKPPVV